MHRAPAVSFWVTRSRWHARSIALCTLLALACTAAFANGQALNDWRLLLCLATTLAVSAGAWLAWRSSPQGCLQWDGQQWSWSGLEAGQSCHISLLMDFQRVMLVRITADTRAVYLWLEAGADDAAWKPLRRAIVSSPRYAADENHAPQPEPQRGAA